MIVISIMIMIIIVGSIACAESSEYMETNYVKKKVLKLCNSLQILDPELELATVEGQMSRPLRSTPSIYIYIYIYI